VVFEDWDGLRDRVASGVPGGPRIVATVDAIAGACLPGPLSGQDLVHGNFNLANTIATPGRLWVVDVEALGAGPRAYDWPRHCWSVPGTANSPSPPRPGCGPTPPGWTAGTSRSAPARSA
jgi:hypothetical protein